MSKERVFIFLILLAFFNVSAQSTVKALHDADLPLQDSAISGQNILTIYVIPSKVKYDWTSPHTLYKSYIKNSIRGICSKPNYLLGHAFVDLRSSMPGERIMAGMSSASRKEQKDLVIKQHYGLAILGCDMQGRFEEEEYLKPILEKFSHKGRLAFMEFIISDSATERLLMFFKAFKAGIESDSSNGARYGGAFYPLYKGEGSGCSAFVISFLDLAGLLKEEFEEWLVKIDIPLALIGGPYNDNKDVRLKDIRKERNWASVSETGAGNFEHLEIYDPTLMFEWINKVMENNSFYDEFYCTPVHLEKANGLRIDSRNKPLPEMDSLFIHREKPSLFIDHYKSK
jgi:hypothetical protein